MGAITTTLFLFFMLNYISPSNSISLEQLYLWPQPRCITLSPDTSPLWIAPSFTISPPPNSPELLRASASRFRRRILSEEWSPVSNASEPPPATGNSTSSIILLSLRISVADPHADLQHGVDESYELLVSRQNSSAWITSNTTWGALHALETFSQLVRFDPRSRQRFIPSGVVIRDEPLYPHRGILLDTSRNFFTIKELRRTIRAMAHNKLNVLHWHISDSHSFPLELESEPELAGKGSYGAGFTYTRDDVKRLVSFARSRGVRVVPEIDAPGHTASWGAAYPEIVTCLGKFWWDPNTQKWAERMAAEPGSGQLNPLHNTTYKVLRNVINEVSQLFPDTFFHAGADEITPGCWNSSHDITEYLRTAPNATMSSLLEMFITKTYPILRSNGKTVIYWEDILLDQTIRASPGLLPPETTIIQTWNNGAANTKAVTAAGYRAVVSSSDFLYLDCGRGDFLLNDTRFDQPNVTVPPASFNITGDAATFNYGGTGGSWCAPYKTWQRIYGYDLAYGLTEVEAARVLGAEAALWSETADGATLDSLLWPRGAALAEMTWSGNLADGGSRKRTAEAGYRLAEWRERMVQRGVAAQAMMPRWCLRNVGMCNINI